MIRAYCWFMVVVLVFDLLTMIFDWVTGSPASMFVWSWAILGCAATIVMFLRAALTSPLALEGRESDG